MSDYKEIIKQIKDRAFKRVLVTGPQRSGTTITAKIVAHELGFDYIDEKEIKINNFDLLFSVYQKRKFVLQAPGMSAYAHMIPGAVIFMRRPIEEIINSQDRIGFSEKKSLATYFKRRGTAAEIKYRIWDNWQKKKNNMFEIDYHTIKDHPFYIPEDLRKNFTPRQTKL